MNRLFKTSLVSCTLMLMLASSAFAGELIVSAAASLTNAFTEVKTAFEKANPDTTIVTNFAASNPLLKQIEAGAPADIFASADQATMNSAEKKGLINKESRYDFAKNSLVLITPSTGKLAIAHATDLKKGEVARVAVGNPDSVPAGRYAKEVLESKDLWNDLHAKFILGESVRQVLTYVTSGEVDAGFVYKTDAIQGGDKVKIIEELMGKTPVTYPIAIIKSSKNAEEAQKFISFIQSQEGKSILAKYGFN